MIEGSLIESLTPAEARALVVWNRNKPFDDIDLHPRTGCRDRPEGPDHPRSRGGGRSASADGERILRSRPPRNSGGGGIEKLYPGVLGKNSISTPWPRSKPSCLARSRGNFATSATRCNQTWATDFVHDQLVTGRKLRVLTIVDTWSRFSPAVDPRFSYRGEYVVATLERVCREHGYPQSIRVDQGSEFISRDLDLWAYQKDVVLDFSRPGKPTDNSFIESFNGKFRADCLNAHWFLTLDDARRKMEH